MRQRQPDGADLLPARRQAVEDAPGDDEMAARIVVAERQAGACDERRRQRSRTPRRRITTDATKRRRRDGIITCLFYGQNRRLGAGVRARAGCARLVRRRVPRFLVPDAARDQRPPRRADGDAAPVAARALRGGRHRRLDRRLAGPVLHRPQGRRGGPPEALQRRAERACEGVHREVRRAGGPHPVAAAAAGAVQDVRAALGRGGACR